MSGALHFFFWGSDWTGSASATASASTSTTTVEVVGAGGGHKPSNDFIDWDSLWEAREAFLKAIFEQAKRPVPVPDSEDWPDPPLKPRRRR